MVLSGRGATGVAGACLKSVFYDGSDQHASIRVPGPNNPGFFHPQFYLKSDKLAKTNFQYEKRQKELEKKKKKEEKLKRKAEKGSVDEVTGEVIEDDADESETSTDSSNGATPGSTEATPS